MKWLSFFFSLSRLVKYISRRKKAIIYCRQTKKKNIFRLSLWRKQDPLFFHYSTTLSIVYFLLSSSHLYLFLSSLFFLLLLLRSFLVVRNCRHTHLHVDKIYSHSVLDNDKKKNDKSEVGEKKIIVIKNHHQSLRMIEIYLF